MSKPKFIGVDTHYINAIDVNQRRVHLDGAASPLAASIALETIKQLLPHYSNSHSYVHTSAQITSKALEWAHEYVLTFLNANNHDYTAIFTGAGTTAGINRVARGLALARSNRKVVLVSAMEHHANDLPHRQFDNEVHYIPTTGEGAQQGAIDLAELEKLLKKYLGKINYIAVSAISNVTGIINPIVELTRLAHKYDTLILVDAAQAVAHVETTLSKNKSNEEIDFLFFSGHKVYTPTAPGVLVAKKNILESLSGQDLGGGSVSDVSYYDYQLLKEYPHREQSGTPNIVGAIALARVLQELNNYGFEEIEKHSNGLNTELFDALTSLPNIVVYGDHNADRLSALSFNHTNIDHGLLAAILNDYYSIAVRNECFCAHPYVSSMLKEALWELDLSTIAEAKQAAFINSKRGMVRVSISLYNDSGDIESLISALTEIDKQIDDYRKHYALLADGNYQHKSFKNDWRKELNWK